MTDPEHDRRSACTLNHVATEHGTQPRTAQILDFDLRFAAALAQILTLEGFAPRLAFGVRRFWAECADVLPDAAIISLSYEAEAWHLMKRLRERWPGMTIIAIIDGPGRSFRAAAALRMGATAALHKPINIADLSKTLRKASVMEHDGDPIDRWDAMQSEIDGLPFRVKFRV